MADERARSLTCTEVDDLAEAFALGSLDPLEMAAVRSHLSTCPEPHADLAAMGATAPALALAVPEVPAPAGLGPRILAAARAEARATRSERPAAPAPPIGVPRPATATPRRVVPASNPPSLAGRLEWLFRPAWAVAGVAAVLVLALLAWNVQLQSQVSDLTAYRSGVAAVLDAVSVQGGRLAVLSSPTSGTSGGPDGLAALTPGGEVVLAMRNLSPTSGSDVYEAWLIAGSGGPQPVGSFVVGAGGTGTLTASIAAPASVSGAVIALTREPHAGATTPTLPILAQGQAMPASTSAIRARV